MRNSDGEQRWFLRRWVNRLEVDRAVFYSLAARFWQLLASPLSLLLIAVYFTKELQGYYYTFWNLIALQTFAELGFHLMVVHVCSHEWAHLRLDDAGRIAGEAQAHARLALLVRQVMRWMSVAALVFVIVVGSAGIWFFSQDASEVSWQAPWLALVALTGMALCLATLVAVLEGCNQILNVQRFRFYQAVCGHAVVWTCIWLGGGLWAAVAAVAVQIGWELYFIAMKYRAFWQSLDPPGAEPVELSWREEVWPFQWRIAVNSIFHYFAYYLFTPVMFYYHGPALAGQMGMTWTVLVAFQAAALAWVRTRMPRFGMLVAQRDFAELDRIYRRLTTISLGVVCLAAILFIAGAAILSHWDWWLAQRLASRLLPLLPICYLSAGVVLLHVPQCQSMYLRAHKQDPLMPINVAANIAIGAAVYGLGRVYGATEAALGFMLVTGILLLPVSTTIWYRCRASWHREAPPEGLGFSSEESLP